MMRGGSVCVEYSHINLIIGFDALTDVHLWKFCEVAMEGLDIC